MERIYRRFKRWFHLKPFVYIMLACASMIATKTFADTVTFYNISSYRVTVYCSGDGVPPATDVLPGQRVPVSSSAYGKPVTVTSVVFSYSPGAMLPRLRGALNETLTVPFSTSSLAPWWNVTILSAD